MPIRNLYEYEEQSRELLSDDYLSSLTEDDIRQIRIDRLDFMRRREERDQRLLDEGLTKDQIQQLDEIERTRIEPEKPRAGGKYGFGIDDAGVLEGMKQTVEGVFDFGMDVSVGLGIDDDERKQVWKDSVNQRRFASRAQHIEEYGELPPATYEVLGGIVPWMFSAQNGARTALGYIGKNILAGGAAGAAYMQPEEMELADRWWGAAMGSGIGGLGSLFAVPGLVKRSAARSILKGFEETDSLFREQLEQNVRMMTGDPNFAFSAAQLTGRRFWSTMGQSAADKATRQQQNANLDTLVTHLHNKLKQFPGAGGQARTGPMTQQKLVGEIRNTLNEINERMYEQAAHGYARNSEALIKAYGDDVVINGEVYLSKLDDLMSEYTDRLVAVGGKPSVELVKYRQEVDSIVNPHKVIERMDPETKKPRVFIRNAKDGTELPVDHADLPTARKMAQHRANEMNAVSGPNADETLRIVKGLNRLIGGQNVMFEKLDPVQNATVGRALMGALTADMSAAGSNRAAVQSLNNLRAMYRADMAGVRAVNDSALKTIFGMEQFPQNPGTALDRFVREVEPQEAFMNIRLLREYGYEDLVADMQRVALKRQIQRARANPDAPEIDGKWDLEKLANNLTDAIGREGKLGSGLFPPALRAELAQTAQALRVINNQNITGFVSVGGGRLEDASINLISRSPEFFARWVTRIFASGRKFEEALLDPSWRQAARAVAKRDLNSPTGRAAIFYLTNWALESDEQQKWEEARQKEIEESQAYAAEAMTRGEIQ